MYEYWAKKENLVECVVLNASPLLGLEGRSGMVVGWFGQPIWLAPDRTKPDSCEVGPVDPSEPAMIEG